MERINDIARKKFGRLNVIQIITKKRRRFRQGVTEDGEVPIMRGRGNRSLGGDGGLIRRNRHEGERERADSAGKAL